ncbi:MAG: CDP-glycerol glycerophosphotransferase family protein [Acutalibacteraceae bacterium]
MTDKNFSEEKIKKLNDHYYKYLHKEKYRNKLNNFLFFFLWKLAYFISSLKKPDENLILFVANRDKAIPAEYRSIYNYAKEKGYRAICLLQPDLSNKTFYVNEYNKIVADLRFTKHYARAKCTFVYDYYLPAFANKPRKGSKLVQLWHGCGAFKKWGYSTRESSWGLQSDFFEKYNVHQTYTDIITSSKEVNSIYAEAFNCDISKVKALGVARTDVFFDKEFINNASAEVREKYSIPENKKIILWAPTYRGDSIQKSHNEITLDLEKMYNALKDDYVLLIKLHPHLVKGFNANTFAPEYMKGFAIKPHPTYPIEKLLCAADIVISDYSSLIFEYSLLERPMIFYAYDLEEYDTERSFYYDYQSFVPGDIVFDTDEIIASVRKSETNFDKAKIERFKNKFMSACDGNSAKRIFDEMIK